MEFVIIATVVLVLAMCLGADFVIVPIMFIVFLVILLLDCYMKHNGSVQDTAEELFVHRNTVNYKIKKIEALLNVDIITPI